MDGFHLISSPQLVLGTPLQRQSGLKFYSILISPSFNSLGSRLIAFLSLIWCKDQSKSEDSLRDGQEPLESEDVSLDSLAYVNQEDAQLNEISGFRMQKQLPQRLDSLQQDSLFASVCESRCLRHCWTTERRSGNRCLVGCWQGGEQRGEHHRCDSEDCGAD